MLKIVHSFTSSNLWLKYKAVNIIGLNILQKVVNKINICLSNYHIFFNYVSVNLVCANINIYTNVSQKLQIWVKKKISVRSGVVQCMWRFGDISHDAIFKILARVGNYMLVTLTFFLVLIDQHCIDSVFCSLAYVTELNRSFSIGCPRIYK